MEVVGLAMTLKATKSDRAIAPKIQPIARSAPVREYFYAVQLAIHLQTAFLHSFTSFLSSFSSQLPEATEG